MGLRIGIGTNLRIQSRFNWAAQSKVLFDRMEATGITLTHDRKFIIDTAIKAKIAVGLMDAFGDIEYFLAAQSEGTSLLNWLSTSFTAAKISTPSFVSDSYWQGESASAKYLNTQYIPPTHRINTTQTTVCMSMWFVEDSSGKPVCGARSSDNATYMIFLPYSPGRFFAHNDNMGGSVSVPDITGFISIERDGGNVKRPLYQDGIYIGQTAAAVNVNGEVDNELYLLGAKNYLNGAAVKLAYWSIHRPLSKEEHYNHFLYVYNYLYSINAVYDKIKTISVGDDDPDRIIVEFYNDLAVAAYEDDDFAVAGKIVSAVSVSGKYLYIDLTADFVQGEALTITYTQDTVLLSGDNGVAIPSFTKTGYNNIGALILSVLNTNSANIRLIGKTGDPQCIIQVDGLPYLNESCVMNDALNNITITFNEVGNYTIKINNSSSITDYRCADNISVDITNLVNATAITQMASDATVSGDITGLIKLVTLQFAANQKITITGDVSALVDLEELWTSGSHNVVLSGSLTNLIALERIYCESECSFSGSIENAVSLNYCTIYGNNTVSGIVTGLTLLTTLNIHGSPTITGNITGMTELLQLSVGGGTLTRPATIALNTKLYWLRANIGSSGSTWVFTEVEVNQILADLWANRAVNPGNSRLITLNNIGSAAPTGQGIIDKANLIALGWYIATN